VSNSQHSVSIIGSCNKSSAVQQSWHKRAEQSRAEEQGCAENYLGFISLFISFISLFITVSIVSYL
jgi:hypothetical protein